MAEKALHYDVLVSRIQYFDEVVLFPAILRRQLCQICTSGRMKDYDIHNVLLASLKMIK